MTTVDVVPPAAADRRLAEPLRRPRRERAALLSLLVATAALYLWDLGASGWANGFYAAAVSAGSHRWKAMFFGSFDSSNFITVDKPPASLWVMDLSARIFGLSSWSLLVPQALMGVGSVAVLYATVRRRFGAAAGLIAGVVLATAPVAALMFRYDNPDALLTLLLTCSAYAMVRALEGARTRWLVLAGGLVGFAFLAKMLQGLLVVPGFALVYLYAAPTTLGRRVRQLLLGGVAMVVTAGWWVAAVALTPAADRPYIGGSQHNSILELIFGYNGFGRLTGQETGSVGGQTSTRGGQWGPTGLTRLFNSEFGGQVSWLIPTALVVAVAGLWLLRHARRTDPGRAQLLLWASWLVVTGLTFSLAQGIIHPYYSVALAPGIGALVGIGAVIVWQLRHLAVARWSAAASVLAAGGWSYVLLERTPTWHPWLRVVVLIAAVTFSAGIAAGGILRGRLAAAVAATGLVAALAGPAAYAIDTAATPHTGAIPSAGPVVAGGFGGPPGGRRFTGGTPPTGAFAGGGPTGAFPGGAAPGGAPAGRHGPGGAMGGLLDTSTPSAALVRALKADASSYRWVAATIGSNNAAGLQLASGAAVMSIGGFNGTDPTPTLAQFEAYVAAHQVHYFVGSGGGQRGPGGASGAGTAIAAWVSAHYSARTIGGMTVYDLG
jgi:4-amino-4-deoxy-L-arabinose transferase-like glycosyltransferase